MNERDWSLLEDMAENARIAMDATAGLDLAAFEASIPALYTTLHAVQIVGEAANKLSSEARARLPHIPWAQVVATRNIIVHGYRAVDPTIVFNIVRDHLPAFLAAVESLLQDEPDE